MQSKTRDEDLRIAVARQNLRLAIALRETTAAEVSRGAGMSVNALGMFLRGATSISYANLLRVCDELRIPIGILHHPDTITPGRLELHRQLERLPIEDLRAVLLKTDPERRRDP